jgi:glycosyltransferase involved in cell wall biosynthesis
MQLSILIRNLNEAQSLKQTLCALKKQHTDFEYEVVVIDNESDDDSAAIAKEMGCKVFTLKREAFTFGHSLNFGIEKCEGEFILILSAHVILLNEFFLDSIPKYFTDPTIAALRFVNAASGEHVQKGMQYGAASLSFSNDKNFVTDNWQHFIVNHCAAIRRSVWENVKFDEKIFASEDKLWCPEILRKGYLVLYNVPSFYVYIKPLVRAQKIRRQVIEVAAKELITGKKDNNFSGSYLHSMLKKSKQQLRHFYQQISIHRMVYRSLKSFRKEQQL